RRHGGTRRSDATRETSAGGCVTEPDAREGQAGSAEESDRPIVPWKPGNAGGGKGPEVQGQRKTGRQPGGWRGPRTSTEGWAATGDVACQSEAGTHIPLLRAVRQGVPSGRAALRLPALSQQRRRPGGGRADVRGYRSVRRADVAGCRGGRTPGEDVSS